MESTNRNTITTLGSRIYNDNPENEREFATEVYRPTNPEPVLEQKPDPEKLEKNSTRTVLPPEADGMVNPAALSIRGDGCLLENQEDYEFRHCTLKRERIPTHDDDGHPLNLNKFTFEPETKCRVIRCKPQYGG